MQPPTSFLKSAKQFALEPKRIHLRDEALAELHTKQIRFGMDLSDPRWPESLKTRRQGHFENLVRLADNPSDKEAWQDVIQVLFVNGDFYFAIALIPHALDATVELEPEEGLERLVEYLGAAPILFYPETLIQRFLETDSAETRPGSKSSSTQDFTRELLQRYQHAMLIIPLLISRSIEKHKLSRTQFLLLVAQWLGSADCWTLAKIVIAEIEFQSHCQLTCPHCLQNFPDRHLKRSNSSGRADGILSDLQDLANQIKVQGVRSLFDRLRGSIMCPMCGVLIDKCNFTAEMA